VVEGDRADPVIWHTGGCRHLAVDAFRRGV